MFTVCVVDQRSLTPTTLGSTPLPHTTAPLLVHVVFPPLFKLSLSWVTPPSESLFSYLFNCLWASRLYKTKLIAFVDSEPAKFCLIRGSSDVLSCRNIVSATAMEDSKLLLLPWYTRVASTSNIADSPSRLNFDFTVPGFELVKCEPEQPKSLEGGLWLAA